MHGLKRILTLMVLISLAMACAKEPEVKVAHGEDRNLFRKQDLMQGPYELTLLSEKSSKLALAESISDTSKVEFVIEENYLHVIKYSESKKSPYLVYDIIAHVDLVREKDKNGKETQFLVTSTTEHEDWREREYIEVNPATYRYVKVAFGEDTNLFLKSDFSATAIKPQAVTGPLARLAQQAIADGVEWVAFDIGQTILNMYKVEGGKKIPYLQYPIAGHFDLRQSRDNEGRLEVYLKKDDTIELNWQLREYVEVDPYKVKKIDYEKFKTEKDLNLQLVSALDGKSFAFQTDKIPGLDEKVESLIAAKYGLKVGAKLSVQLLKDEMHINTNDSSGAVVTVAKLPLAYFDLQQAENSYSEKTDQFTLNQTLNAWDKRQYVMIAPDSAVLETNENKLVSKALLGHCYSAAALPIPEVRAALTGQEEEVCFGLSESYLSVYSGKPGLNNLLATYYIVKHINVITRDSDQSDLPETWDKKQYLIFAASKPEKVKNLVGPNALSKDKLAGEFIYVTTIEKSHSEAGGRLIPGMRNILDGKIKFEFSENKVTAYRTKETLNSNTKTPVLRFGVNHFTVERVRNSVGDPTATIAETTERGWDKESHVRVRFGDNEIPGYFNEYFGLEKLYFRQHRMSQSRITGEVEIAADGMITFYTEEVLTPDATSGFYGEGETALEPKSVLMRHTFMPVNNSSYTPKKYEAKDFLKFGYFRTFEYRLDENGRPTDDTLFTYINRFNLSGGRQIVYTVNQDFPAKYWDIAVKAIGEWNAAFKAATGRTDDVVVLKKNTGESYTDPRVNMIAYIPDRIITGILGYGPMISDPESGEILASQTYMYDAVFKSVRAHLEKVYDHIKANLPGEKIDVKDVQGAATKQDAERVINDMRTAPTANVWQVAESAPSVQQQMVIKAAQAAVTSNIKARRSNWQTMFERLGAARPDLDTAILSSDLDRVSFATSNVMSNLDLQKLYNKPHCFFDADNQLSSAIKFIRLHKDKSKEEVLDILEKQAVYTTLLHELGHNFGLRHNFFGSFDEKNFGKEYHTIKEELAAGNPSAETEERFLEMWKSSTVMDYIASFEEQFTGLGDYDKAAIYYGYGQLVEAKKSPLTQNPPSTGDYHLVPKEILDQIVADTIEANPGAPAAAVEQYVNQVFGVRSYLFCTDEHVDNDPTCNRHDSGVTVEEMVKSWIDDYELNYLLYAERDGRRNFTGSSYFVLYRYFLPIRQVFDEFVYKLVTNSFPATSGAGGQQDYINGLITGLNFFTEIIETPEAGVYHLDTAAGKFVKGEPTAADQKKLIVPEGFGKTLMGTFAPINGVDQPTKRGHLLDKLLAMLSMTLRGFPAEKYQRASLTVNYYDLEVFRTPLFTSFSSAMRGELAKNSKAVYFEPLKTYIAVTEEVARQLADDMEVIDAKLDASSNNIVEDYSMIFAVADFNNDGDQTFADYVDFRTVGVDDDGIPAGVETVKFISASGTKEYVVPQTVDGRSITFSMAKGAPLISEKYHDLVDFLNDPATKEQLNTLVETATPLVLEEFKKIWERVEGSPMPDSVVQSIMGNKQSGLTQMIELTGTLLTNYQNALAQAEAAGDAAAVAKYQELVDFITERKTAIDGFSKEFSELNKNVDEGESQAFKLKNELIEIESRLLKLKKFYSILN